MNFYVYQQSFKNPEAHMIDIFVGPEPPALCMELGKFDNVDDLHEFLKSVKVTYISTFKHPLCPENLIDDLNQWIESNLSLKAVHQSEGSGA
jgi:hypothetical protein